VSPPAAAARVAGSAPGRDAIRRGYGAPRPRRVSGPTRRAPETRPLRARPRRGGLPLSLIAALGRLANHRLLDRLIRGRAWLVLVTFALIGIVTLQLALLKLNGGVGRTLQTQSQLQRENASLSIENSELAAADRVQSRAAQMGMEFASSTALRSLAANPHVDVKRAAGVLSAPVRSQTPGSAEGSARAQSSGGEGSSASSSEGASAPSASTAESKPSGEASTQSATGAQAAAGSTGGAAQSGGEATASGQTGARESETASGSGGGQAAPESGSSG
jgi:cell division protein FtsL